MKRKIVMILTENIIRTNSSIKTESIEVEERLRVLLGAEKPLSEHKGNHTDDLWFKDDNFFVEHKDCTAKNVGLNQVHCTRYEVIVVDNNSQDETEELIKANFERVTFQQNNENDSLVIS